MLPGIHYVAWAVLGEIRCDGVVGVARNLDSKDLVAFEEGGDVVIAYKDI